MIDGKGALAMPGLCNLHTHTPMTLFRSIGADLPLDRWLQEAIWPLEKFLTDDAVRAGTDLGTLEMLRYGTTSFNDMYFRMDRMAESVQESGMRAMLGHGVVDFDESCSDLLPGIAFAEKWNGAANDRIHVNLAPHSEGATTRKVMERTVEEARRLNVAIHIHVSETKADRDGSVQRRGKTPPQYLDELGMLDGPLLAAHCVWMDDEDIRLFAEKGTYIVHNPISNLKLASGVAPIAKMLAAGCKVALGTDGVASNNNLNLWEEIKLMPMLQKGTTLDPTVGVPGTGISRRHQHRRGGFGLLRFGSVEARLSGGYHSGGYDWLQLLPVERPGERFDLLHQRRQRDHDDGGRTGAVPGGPLLYAGSQGRNGMRSERKRVDLRKSPKVAQRHKRRNLQGRRVLSCKKYW